MSVKMDDAKMAWVTDKQFDAAADYVVSLWERIPKFTALIITVVLEVVAWKFIAPYYSASWAIAVHFIAAGVFLRIISFTSDYERDR